MTRRKLPFPNFNTASDLKKWINKPTTQESDTFDFKENLSNPETMRKCCCSFANNIGGFIFLGVRDDKTVVGIDIPENEITTKMSQILTKFISPIPIDISIFKVFPLRGGKMVYIIEVHESDPQKKPHIITKNEAIYIPIRRAGHVDYITSHSEIRNLFLQNGTFYREQTKSVRKILENIQNCQHSFSSLSLVENSVILGFYNFLRSEGEPSDMRILSEFQGIIEKHTELTNMNRVTNDDLKRYSESKEDIFKKIRDHLTNNRKFYE